MVNKQDGMRWAALLIGVLFLAIMVLVGFTDARAQPLTTYDELFCFTRSFDQWTIDSVIFRLFEASSGATDSGATLVTYDTARYASRVDTLCFVVNVNATTISKTRNPSILGVAFLSDGREIHEVKSMAHLVHSVDTARSANASLVIDSTSLAAIIAAINEGLGGTGDYPETLVVFDSTNDAIILGARVSVYATDTGSFQNGSGMQYTDIFGKAVYSLDAGTFPVAVSAHGFFQPSAYQLVVVDSGGGTDTVFMRDVGLIAPPEAGLTPIVFTFRSALDSPIVSAPCWYKLNLRSPHTQAHHLDSTKTIDASRTYYGRTDTLGQITMYVVPNDSILVKGNKTGQTFWQFFAEHPETGMPLLGADGLKVTVPARVGPLYWPDSAAAFGE